MGKSRVTVDYGASPIILVAPHGSKSDDFNTDLLTERTADLLNCNYVINHGWRKSDTLDIKNEKANCNNFYHMIDEVYDEFCKPILEMASTVLKFYDICFVAWIHGVSDNVRNIYKKNDIDVIFGDGEASGTKNKTCTNHLKEFVIKNLCDNGIKCYSSYPGNKYNGASISNMNQLWNLHVKNTRVQSFQLEVVKELREDKTMTILSSDYFADALKNIENYRLWTKPHNSSIRFI